MEIASSDLYFHGGVMGKNVFQKRKRGRERKRVAFCLAKCNWFDKVVRDKLYCLTDIGVAFERLGRGDKSWRKYGNFWQTRGYILEFAM